MKLATRNVRYLFFMAFFAILTACSPLIAQFNATAYQNATSVKAETLTLMDKANEPYDSHKAEVDNLFLDANKALEFVKGQPANSISTQQWEILIKRDGNLMGSFFANWAANKTMSPTFIQEKKMQISNAFDEIICLEYNKKETQSCSKAKGGQ